VKELVNSDCKFGFCMKTCIYSQLEWSRILKFGPIRRKSQTLAPKNAISHHMSPRYINLQNPIRYWVKRSKKYIR